MLLKGPYLISAIFVGFILFLLYLLITGIKNGEIYSMGQWADRASQPSQYWQTIVGYILVGAVSIFAIWKISHI